MRSLLGELLTNSQQLLREVSEFERALFLEEKCQSEEDVGFDLLQYKMTWNSTEFVRLLVVSTFYISSKSCTFTLLKKEV